MVLETKRSGRLVLPLIVGLALLGWPRVGAAQGTWSVISLPQKPGDVISPGALAVDAAGNLYVADQSNGGRIQKRDAQGNWSVMTPPGQVFGPFDLAVDAAGNLYVADHDKDGYGRIQKRDAQGNWSVIATRGDALGQVYFHYYGAGLAVDTAGNLYVAYVTDLDPAVGFSRIQKRDAQGNWSVIANFGTDLGQVNFPSALARDSAGNLYVSDYGRIQKRDAQGNWSVIATRGDTPGQVTTKTALAVDTEGNLYVAEHWYDGSVDHSRIQKRDAQGTWSVIATAGSGLGQISLDLSSGLAVDDANNLYVADTGNNRVQKYTPSGQ
jgi:cellulase/cellobiase CelA1